jgi:hypothetical protein
MRTIEPGERLGPDCNSHCGIRSAADEGRGTFIGHCPQCHGGPPLNEPENHSRPDVRPGLYRDRPPWAKW